VHNKEMHSKNGNIDRVDDVQGGREALVTHLRESFWDLPPINAPTSYIAGTLLPAAERHFPRLYFCDPDGAQTYYTNCGSLHQLFGPHNFIERMLSSWMSPRTERDSKEHKLY